MTLIGNYGVLQHLNSRVSQSVQKLLLKLSKLRHSKTGRQVSVLKFRQGGTRNPLPVLTLRLPGQSRNPAVFRLVVHTTVWFGFFLLLRTHSAQGSVYNTV